MAQYDQQQRAPGKCSMQLVAYPPPVTAYPPPGHGYPPPSHVYPPPAQPHAPPPATAHPYVAPPYATMHQQQPLVETKSKGDGFWKGCFAALCCCCVLDMCCV